MPSSPRPTRPTTTRTTYRGSTSPQSNRSGDGNRQPTTPPHALSGRNAWWEQNMRPQPIPDMIRHPLWEDSMRDDYNAARNQASQDWQGQQDLLNMLGAPAPAPTSNGGSRGGGGGGGGASAQAAKQATALQQLLGSGAFTAQRRDSRSFLNEDMGKVGAAVSADQGAARSAYDQLSASMAGMANPYQGMQVARTPQVAPELLSLLGANGGDTRAYEAQIGLANTLGAQGDSAADRLTQRMAGMVDQSRQSRVAEAGQASQYAQSELGAQRTAMEMALQGRDRERMQRDDEAFRQQQTALDGQKMQVIMQLIQAMSEGGQSVDVGQFFK